MRIRVVLLVFAAVIEAGCAGVPRNPLLLEDCGGFVPPDAVTQAVSVLGDPALREAALAGVEAMAPRYRVELLRAGLRLRDPAAARSCAARLEWQQIDRWECARCVDLLVDDVLRPGSEANFEEFRSYIGSVELSRFLHSLPPLPWSFDTVQAIAQMHRIARAGNIPDFLALTRHPDPAVRGEAFVELGLLGRWNDDFREEVEGAFLSATGVTTGALPAVDAPVLPRVLAAGLRRDFLQFGDDGPKTELPCWDRRWLWECVPRPSDAMLLMDLAKTGDANWSTVSGTAFVLLGRLSDPETEAFLRHEAEDGELLARWALARRGDAAMLDTVVEDVAAGEEFALALLMEADSARARRVIEETLLGPDERAAEAMLEELGRFAKPGAFFEPLGFEWRRTSLDGLAAAATAARIPPLRLARIGVTIPGCRTRALARAAAVALGPGDLFQGGEPGVSVSEFPAIGGFLETAAPEEFAAALRRIRAADGADAFIAGEWLVKMGDPDACAALAASPDADWSNLRDIGRSRAPGVRSILVERARRFRDSAKRDDIEEGPYAIAALAEFHGLPEEAAEAFILGFEEHPRAAVEAVLEGRPLDGLAAILAALPDEEHGDIGGVDDPRVRAYLVRLRERRELGCYWYATGQLAVAGDPAARAEFWGAMEDGRYRIMDEAEEFERTLGFDLPATMPFWIDELRSQCCRIVTTDAGDIVEKLLGLDDGCFDSPYRTAWRRAKELWDSADGRFVRSRVAGYWVPEPR